jgi:hypothetical protein
VHAHNDRAPRRALRHHAVQGVANCTAGRSFERGACKQHQSVEARCPGSTRLLRALPRARHNPSCSGGKAPRRPKRAARRVAPPPLRQPRLLCC